jgi:hypothetical protein
VCVFITAVPITKLFAWGGGRGGLGLRRLVFHDNVGVCVFITAVPITKLFARGGGDSVSRRIVVVN